MYVVSVSEYNQLMQTIAVDSNGHIHWLNAELMYIGRCDKVMVMDTFGHKDGGLEGDPVTYRKSVASV